MREAGSDLADRLRNAFPAWRRMVTENIRTGRIVLWLGCGHRIGGSYMMDAVVIIDSLEPRLWTTDLRPPGALWT